MKCYGSGVWVMGLDVDVSLRMDLGMGLGRRTDPADLRFLLGGEGAGFYAWKLATLRRLLAPRGRDGATAAPVLRLVDLGPAVDACLKQARVLFAYIMCVCVCVCMYIRIYLPPTSVC